MRQFLALTAVVIFLSLPFKANASSEGVLLLGAFQVASPGIGQSGPVVVSGEQNANQVSALTIQAFGKTVALSKADLAKLRAGLINGIQLSYEAGYPELGGRTVYVVLSKGFTSGLKESQRVSVNEQGKVEIINEARK